MIIMTQYIYDNNLITMSNGILGEEKCSEATSLRCVVSILVKTLKNMSAGTKRNTL